jgi:phage anti-repressor protein
MDNTNLINFLKKYTNISNKFIDDFFSLYTIKTSKNDFVINLENVAKWLKTEKRDIKKTLVKSYEINIDYIIKKNNIKNYFINDIHITPECFKRLCMLSRTEKAEEVRTYFIEIENVLDNYKNVIIDHLNKRIDILENNQKPTIDTNVGLIYILKSNDDIENIYKIGKSKKFKERILSHNSSHPDNV